MVGSSPDLVTSVWFFQQSQGDHNKPLESVIMAERRRERSLELHRAGRERQLWASVGYSYSGPYRVLWNAEARD